jgi:hypothetical protein
MGKNKKIEKISLILITLFLISGVSAFGVGCAYHKDNPLKISAGETKEIVFNLQNMPGPNDLIVKSEISKGSEIIEIPLRNDVLVPVGGSVDITALVKIPSDSKIGNVYPVEVTFTTAKENTAGGFGLGSSVKRNFDVIIVQKEEQLKIAEEEKPSQTKIVIYSLFGVILLIVLILFIISRKKKNKRKKK